MDGLWTRKDGGQHKTWRPRASYLKSRVSERVVKFWCYLRLIIISDSPWKLIPLMPSWELGNNTGWNISTMKKGKYPSISDQSA